MDRLNTGDHIGAVVDVAKAESISRAPYPADNTEVGQEPRLRQEYFFASTSLQDLLDRHLCHYHDPCGLPGQVAIQLNDTHPVIAVVELIRQLANVH